MIEHTQCRHIRAQGMPAVTTVHQLAIPGVPTSASALDNFVELCPLCSAIVASIMIYVTADDPKVAKQLLLEMISLRLN